MDGSCPILYVSDVLRVVLDSLTGDKRSIVSLAYTSKAVSGIALDYLWAHMDSFGPFMPLLPYPAQNIKDQWSDPDESSPSIECPPPEKWQLFDMYAYRVRQIYLSLQDRDLYEQLASIRTGVNLFPRLSSLDYSFLRPLVPGVKIFPSSLRILSISTEYSSTQDYRVSLALHQAAHDAPCLEALYISARYGQYEGLELQPLDFKRLHTVRFSTNRLCSADLQGFLCHLSTSPIRNLQVSFSDFSWSTDTSLLPSFQLDDTIIPPNAFPLVEDITFVGNPRWAADIVSRIHSPYLKSVTIMHHDRYTTPSGYDCFFSLLAQRHPPIFTLEVETGSIFITTPNEYIRGFLAALEVVAHAGLSELSVKAFVPGLDPEIEEDVKERVRRWPLLTDFEFVFL